MKRILALVVQGYAALGLAGCTGRSHDQQNLQVVATVNDQQITVSQLNQVLQSSDTGSVAPEVAKHAIDSLVSEELLVQGAMKHRLDRDPAVVQAIDTARRQVLARSFAERNLYPKKAATNVEITDFYKSNPILFENRKRFQMKNYSIPSIDLSDRLRAELEQAHSVSELRDSLDRHDIKYSSVTTAITADQLPVDKLAEFARAKAGDLMIAEQSNGRTMLMFITAIEDDNPMSFDRAKPYIELYLANLRNGQAVSDYLTRARAASKISYPRTAAAAELTPVRPPATPADDRINSETVELNPAQTHATP